jgi:hypothetical protein
MFIYHSFNRPLGSWAHRSGGDRFKLGEIVDCPDVQFSSGLSWSVTVTEGRLDFATVKSLELTPYFAPANIDAAYDLAVKALDTLRAQYGDDSVQREIESEHGAPGLVRGVRAMLARERSGGASEWRLACKASRVMAQVALYRPTPEIANDWFSLTAKADPDTVPSWIANRYR